MEKIKLNKKSIGLIIMAIIVIGIIVIAVRGLNVSLIYTKNTSININLGQEFKNQEIKQLAKEVYGKRAKVLVQKVEIYEDMVRVIVKESTNEQTTELVNKINARYGLGLNAEKDAIVENNTNVRLRTLAEESISALVISFVAILIYTAIRYRKNDWIGAITKLSVIILGTELFLLSIIAIARIPVGRTTIPVMLAVYCISVFCGMKKINK